MACAAKAEELLGKLSGAEKAAQMIVALQSATTASDVTTHAPGAVFSGGNSAANASGSFQGTPKAAAWTAMIDKYQAAAAQSSNKIPLLFGVDAVHGNNKVAGAVVFPHNIGLGCANDAALAEEVGKATALEMAAVGMNWTFGPSLSVSWDDRWGRVYESYSEDPVATSVLGSAVVRGLQGRGGPGSGAPGVVACAKHFAGDGLATANTSAKGGIIDRGDVRVDEETLRRIGVEPFRASIEAGVGSIMVTDARWNGENVTGSSKAITEILKGELGFKGVVVTDWNAAQDGVGAGNLERGVIGAINAGVDMLMQKEDNWKSAQAIIERAAGTEIPQERIDDAVRRVLALKCEAGLFEQTWDPALATAIGQASHRELARDAVRKSLVLLKNDGTLPLGKGSKVFLTGSGADDLERQCGGWTIFWQDGGSKTTGTTVRSALGKSTTLVASPAEADIGVVVLSEKPYAEFLGDDADLELPPEDLEALDQVTSAGKPVVAVMLSGRPVMIAPHLDRANAWVAAWLPGSEGDGVADVLVGDYRPSGKLSHSWPRDLTQVNKNAGDAGFDPLFPLGYGLTY